MLPLLAIIIGLLIGLFINVSLPNVVYPYLALIILCTLDALIGGVKARYARRYSAGLFITGWLGNCLAAVFLNALGDALGVNLALPVEILLGMRIFKNVASLRRIWLSRIERRQRTLRVWVKNTGKGPEDLPAEALSGEPSEREKKAEDLRARARRLRLEADSLLNEADVLFEQDAMDKLLLHRKQQAEAAGQAAGEGPETAENLAEPPPAKEPSEGASGRPDEKKR